MPVRTYAQIECSLKASKKLRKLSSHKARWAYLCVHLSDFATYTGLFQYPLHMWAHDAMLTPDELENAVAELVTVGLIEFDPEEHFVRIVGWFHKRSGPDNPNRILSVIVDLQGLDDAPPEMVQAAAAELAVASVKRAMKWKDDSNGRVQLHSQLRGFLNECLQDYGDGFLGFLEVEADQVSPAVVTELRAIFHVFGLREANPSERVTPTLAKHETKTKRNEDETKTKKDKDDTAYSAEIAEWERKSLAEASESLRKSARPSLSVINSPLAQAARGGA